jgi:D-serine dehydratase
MVPVYWENPRREPWAVSRGDVPLTAADVEAARARFARHRKALARLFGFSGVIESPLRALRFAEHVSAANGGSGGASALVLIKLDGALPVAGSIKARGGIHEVLVYAERLLTDAGYDLESTPLDDPGCRALFAAHRIAVGSTGNLGLSIGLMSRALGLEATVHMSSDARQWKKDLLRSVGATVVEYAEDYSVAVERGRAAAADDPATHFVDDENSRDLFLGYAVAGEEVRTQLAHLGHYPTTATPLTVYLPCGVGGGPGGVCFGLKLVFGDAVRCVFVEPTHSPAMILGLATDLHDGVSVADIGLDNRTVADGLAVGRPSRFVGSALRRIVDAAATVEDERMVALVGALRDSDGLRLEPSATAGVAAWMDAPPVGGTHLIWATGGGLLPDEEFERYCSATRR